jgi:acyl carrier protein
MDDGQPEPIQSTSGDNAKAAQDLEAKILKRLAEKFGGSPQLSDDLVLIGVDSIGMAELALELEKEFQISVDEAIVDNETVQDLADYVRERMQQK